MRFASAVNPARRLGAWVRVQPSPWSSIPTASWIETACEMPRESACAASAAWPFAEARSSGVTIPKVANRSAISRDCCAGSSVKAKWD